MVNLTTDDETGYATGVINDDVSFRYFSGERYNISLKWYGDIKTFNVNSSDQYPNVHQGIQRYNYTLGEEQEIILDLILNIEDYKTNFTETYNSSNEVTWGNELTLAVKFESTTTGGPPWTPINDADKVINLARKIIKIQ